MQTDVSGLSNGDVFPRVTPGKQRVQRLMLWIQEWDTADTCLINPYTLLRSLTNMAPHSPLSAAMLLRNVWLPPHSLQGGYWSKGVEEE